MDNDILRMKLKENTGKLNAICGARLHPIRRKWAQGRQFPCPNISSFIWKEFPSHWLFCNQEALHDGNYSCKEMRGVPGGSASWLYMHLFLLESQGGPAELPIQAGGIILPLQQRTFYRFPPCRGSKETRDWSRKRSVGWLALLFLSPKISINSREVELVGFVVSGTWWNVGQMAKGGWEEEKEEKEGDSGHL